MNLKKYYSYLIGIAIVGVVVAFIFLLGSEQHVYPAPDVLSY
jgi:hypothetical protein